MGSHLNWLQNKDQTLVLLMSKSRSFHVCLFPHKRSRRRVGVGQRKDTSLIFFFLSYQKVTTNRDFNLIFYILLSCPGSSSGDKTPPCHSLEYWQWDRKEGFRHNLGKCQGAHSFPSLFPSALSQRANRAEEGVTV